MRSPAAVETGVPAVKQISPAPSYAWRRTHLTPPQFMPRLSRMLASSGMVAAAMSMEMPMFPIRSPHWSTLMSPIAHSAVALTPS